MKHIWEERLGVWWIAADHPDQPAIVESPSGVEVAGGHEPSDGLARELIEFCRSRLAGYKCPRSVDFREAFPRTDGGKLIERLLKEECRQLASAGE